MNKREGLTDFTAGFDSISYTLTTICMHSRSTAVPLQNVAFHGFIEGHFVSITVVKELNYLKTVDATF